MRRIAMVCLLACSACSFIWADGPPDNHERLKAFACSQSNWSPVLDTIWASASAVTAAVFAGSRSTNTLSGSEAIIAIYGAQAALWGASAVYGFSMVGKCKSAQAALMERVQTAPPEPPPWPTRPPAACTKDTDCPGNAICESGVCVAGPD